jgi:hypothetical protein
MIKNMKNNIGGANDVGIIDHGREQIGRGHISKENAC